MRYQMRQKLWSLTDGFVVKDESGNDACVIDAKFFALRQTLLMHDMFGNELLTIRPFLQFGYTAPARFARDVLTQPGARAVILLEGINDIGDRSAKAEDLIPVYQQLIVAAHDAGLLIYGGTLLPFAGSNATYGGDYGTPAGEQERQR